MGSWVTRESSVRIRCLRITSEWTTTQFVIPRSPFRLILVCGRIRPPVVCLGDIYPRTFLKWALTPPCARTLWPDGTLFEMVEFNRHNAGSELTDEELDRWLESFPVH